MDDTPVGDAVFAVVAGPLRVLGEPDRRVVVCPVNTDLDADTCADFANALTHALEPAPAVLVVDLAAVGFCDSTGLNVLLHTRLNCERTGTALRLTGISPQMRRLLELVGANRVFDLRPDLASATEA